MMATVDELSAGGPETVNVQFYVEALEAELAAANNRAVRLAALSRELQAEVARLKRVNEALQQTEETPHG